MKKNSEDNAQSKKDFVKPNIFPFSSENLEPHLKYTPRGDYLLGYFNDLKAKTCVLEEKYIDKDYMLDYQKFYSRAFEKIDRVTKRIHFFDDEFSYTDFREEINKEGEELRRYLKQLNDSYLGCIVVKPDIIKDFPLIGRTLVKTYPLDEENKRRFFIRDKYHVSLFGIPLNIKSLPFQDQDEGVSKCATIALWTAMQPLINPYGLQTKSPAEITEMATRLPSPSRRFPSEGLDVNQILNYIQLTGLDAEIIKPTEESMTMAVKAYITARFPIIAFLALYKTGQKEEDYDWHSAVISGYKSDENRNIEELYVHDDGIGPYNKVLPVNGNFLFLDNEWIQRKDKERYDYDKCEVTNLFVPVYPKVRLTFEQIYSYFEEKQNRIRQIQPDFDLELYLYTIRKYKNELLKFRIKDKVDILKSFLPRFLWVKRTYRENQQIRDDIYDATSTYIKYCKTIEYLD